MQEEIWKDIPNYEGIYQVSNLGRVKSLSRENYSGKGIKISKEKILKYSISIYGYACYRLSKLNNPKDFRGHQLVAMAFLNHIICGHKIVVDHINDNRLDNRVENLQLITNRENAYRTQGKYSSQYKGVSWCKRGKKWRANIRLNKKSFSLGYFVNEYDAHLAYQNKLKEIL